MSISNTNIRNDVDQSLLSTAIERCKQNCPVEIGKSKRHGNGVFAKRDIAKNEALCYYDGEDYINATEITLDQHAYSYEVYYSDNKCITRIGYKDLPLQSSYGCAQFINDALSPVVPLEATISATTGQIVLSDALRVISSYNRKSQTANMTTAMQKLDKSEAAGIEIGWVFARRDIRKGEEIVTHYGEHYWFKHMIGHSTKAAVLLLIMGLYEKEFLENHNSTDDETTRILKKYRLYEAVYETWKSTKAVFTKPECAISMHALLRMFIKETIVEE